MTYCDSSFLIALYLEADHFHLQSRQLATQFRHSIPLIPLAELELHNGLHRCVAAGTLKVAQRDTAIRQIEADETSGVFSRPALSSTAHFAKAMELSRKYTPQLSTRSLDILHVAAALLLKASDFASFDDRQRLLAEKAGLKLLPR